MDICPVARQESPDIPPIPPEADLPVQPERAGLSLQFPAERAIAEYVQGEGPSRPLGPGKHLQHEPVVLHWLQVAYGDEVAERFGVGRLWCGRDEVTDDGEWQRRGIGEPADQRAPRPLRHVHEAVDLGNHLPFGLTDRAKDGPIALYLPLVGPLVRL